MKLSLLVPTFNRPKKIARLFRYLKYCFETNLMQNVSEVIVADGSTRSMAINTKSLIMSELPLGLSEKTNYITLDGSPLLNRLGILALEASENAILYSGDDDFPDFFHLDTHLGLMNNDKDLHTIAGCYSNIVFDKESKKLVLSSAERPYHSLLINHPSPVVRILQYFTLDSVGTASLSYGILRRERFVEFYRSLSQKEYYYGGVEHMQKYHALSEGFAFLSPFSAIIRDFLYHNYVIEAMREAPNDDPYPYHGISAVTKCAEILAAAANLSTVESFDVVNYQLKSSAAIVKSRTEVQMRLGHGLIHRPSDLTMAAFTRAFNETYSNVYQN